MTLLVPRKVDLPVPSLPDLSKDVELVELELRPALAEDDSFTTFVRGPFRVGLGGGEGARGDGGLEG